MAEPDTLSDRRKPVAARAYDGAAKRFAGAQRVVRLTSSTSSEDLEILFTLNAIAKRRAASSPTALPAGHGDDGVDQAPGLATGRGWCM